MFIELDWTASDFRCNLARDHRRDRLARLSVKVMIRDEALEPLLITAAIHGSAMVANKTSNQDFGRGFSQGYRHEKQHGSADVLARPDHFPYGAFMQYVTLMSFCERTGFTPEQARDYELRGIIRSTTKGKNHFYSLREVYRVKGILYFIRTQGLSPEDAAARIDKEAMSTNPG